MSPETLWIYAEKAARYLLAGLILLVLYVQLSSLYVFPMPDGARWWGDETGQIIELRTELETGHASIPVGRASTVAVTNGLLRGNSWLAAGIYGLPALIFERSQDLVTIGRTITAILSCLLLVALFFCSRSFGVPVVLSELGVLILLSTRSFLFASHSARLDIAAGISVLVYITYLARKVRIKREGVWRPTALWFFLFGASTFALATLSIHLLTLLAVLALFALWQLGALKNIAYLFSAITGVLVVAAVLFLLYSISGAPITFLGVTTQHTQFHSVISEIPITKLFSRSAQLANLQQRWTGFFQEAPAILALVLIAIVSSLITLKHRESASQHFLFIGAIIVFLSWLLFQSYAIYYYTHVLPLLVAVALVAINKALRDAKRATVVASVVVAFTVAHFGFYDALAAHESGSKLTHADQDALTSGFSLPTFHIGPVPLVLIQNPGLAWLLHFGEVHVMSPHFLSFPLDDRSPSEVLRAQHVQYVVLYFDPENASYSDEVQPLRAVADSIGKPIATFTGSLFDAGRNYFRPDWSRIDTLRIYSLPY